MDTKANDISTNSPAKRRNPFLAALMSLLLPGLGQVYNGQLKKGLFFLGLLYFFICAFGLIGATRYFAGLATLLGIELILRIYIIADATITALRQKNFTAEKYNTWYGHLAIGIVIFILFIVCDAGTILGTRTYKIPTGSNIPTVHIGDWVIADHRAYNSRKIDYGDIVVFRAPDGEVYLSRVVGLPGDRLALKDNVVSVNENVAAAKFVQHTSDNGIPVDEFIETLPNGHSQHIYRATVSNVPEMATIDSIIVPTDNYFLLGDNRDNSLDSRYRGPIARKDILGRVIYAYWGASTDRINLDFRDK